jgi:hypothetical protein
MLNKKETVKMLQVYKGNKSTTAKVFVLQVLNDANEWELIAKKFSTQKQAEAFYNAELSMFADCEITELE